MRSFQSELVYNLWKHLESEKIRHLVQVRNGIPLDIHYHVWESAEDVARMLHALTLKPVEIVEDYLGNSILFVVKAEKNNQPRRPWRVSRVAPRPAHGGPRLA